MGTETDIKVDIEKIFDKGSAGAISIDELNQVSARIFVETLGELNRLNDELVGVSEKEELSGNKNEEKGRRAKLQEIEGQIILLKKKYSSYLNLLTQHIVKSCDNDVMVKKWLEIAAKCELNGNDFLGLAIENSMNNGVLRNSIKNHSLSDSYDKLMPYFKTIQQNEKYIDTLKKKSNEASLSPLLKSYFDSVGGEFLNVDIKDNTNNKKYNEIEKQWNESAYKINERNSNLENSGAKNTASSNDKNTKILKLSKENPSSNYLKLKIRLKNAKIYYRKRRDEIKNLLSEKIKRGDALAQKKKGNEAKNTGFASRETLENGNKKGFANNGRKGYQGSFSSRLFKNKSDSKSIESPEITENYMNNNKKIK